MAPNPTAPPAMERPATARDVMTSPVVTAPETLLLADAVRLMTERGVKALPVTDARGHFVGLVNRAGLLRALLRAWASIVASDHGASPAQAPPAFCAPTGRSPFGAAQGY